MTLDVASVVLDSAIILTTPILLAAIGELILERSGILNIGIEGVMLVGAFAGYLLALYTGNVYLGMLGAVFGGLAIALIHGLISITLGGDQVVSGISLIIFSYGVTTFALKLIFGLREVPAKAPGLDEVPIPLLSELPIIGGALFSKNILVYLAFLLVPALWLVMHKTTWGLQLKAVGEDPRVADSVGIDVVKVRYLAILLNGTLGGLAGVSLSLGFLEYFTPGMTAGRGFLALAAVIFGKWSPIGVVAASLIFGGVDALQIRLQLLELGVPYPFMLMLPYLVTIVALSLLRYIRAPKALAMPYKRG